jgi:ubiquinone biosynthesis protein UbiJ
MDENFRDGGVAAALAASIVAMWHTISSRGHKRIREIAVVAVEESKKFALAGEQGIINEKLAEDVNEVRQAVERTERKVDDLKSLMLDVRFEIRRKD